MACPQCNKAPDSGFGFGGVGPGKYFRGYVKCRTCGTMLKSLGYQKNVWLVLPIMIILAVIGIMLLDSGMTSLNIANPLLRLSLFVLFMILVNGVGLHFGRKYTRYERVTLETSP